MSLEDPQEALYGQLDLILHSLSLKQLPFYNDFKNRWENVLLKNLLDPLVGSSKYKFNSQIYTQKVSLISGFEFDFHYDIPHIYMLYDLECKEGSRGYFASVGLNTIANKVYLNGNPCFYNYYPKEKRKTRYDNPIFLSFRPMHPKEFFVVDGNHCLSALIDKGAKNVTALLINPCLASSFFISSVEMVTYAFLFDAFSISEAIMTGKLTNVKENLIIFQKGSILDNLKILGRIH